MMKEGRDGMKMEQGRNVKGDILLRVLERIAGGVGNTAAMFGAFLEAGYGASYGKLEYQLSRRRRKEAKSAPVHLLQREARRKYQQLLYKLKRDGLVATKAEGERLAIVLTRKGEEKLNRLRTRKQHRLPSPLYRAEKAPTFTVVTFDVPEKEKRKREWLRAALKHLGFSFVQKSVRIGKVKVPMDFLEDVHRLGLVDSVEIFEITKAGSLKHLI